MTIHELKILPKHFNDVISGKKKAEIRYNDRNYKVGDTLVLYEIDEFGNRTGNQCSVIVSHILDDAEYLKDGYVLLSIVLLSRFVLKSEAMTEQLKPCLFCGSTDEATIKTENKSS